MYKRPTSNVVCSECGIAFEKEKREITKSEKRGALHFCTISCAMTASARKQYGDISEFRSIVRNARTRAKEKGLVCDIDYKYLEELAKQQDYKCAITGVPMKFGILGHGPREITQASLDRIDNSKGYTVGNVQFTLLGINYMRNTFSIEEVKNLLATISKISSIN